MIAHAQVGKPGTGVEWFNTWKDRRWKHFEKLGVKMDSLSPIAGTGTRDQRGGRKVEGLYAFRLGVTDGTGMDQSVGAWDRPQASPRREAGQGSQLPGRP